MDSHSYTYEQYCNIAQRNVILEETAYHNGNRELKCLYKPFCSGDGVCKNRFVKSRASKVEKNEK